MKALTQSVEQLKGTQPNRTKARRLLLSEMGNSTVLRITSIFVLLLGSVVLAAIVSAYSYARPKAVAAAKTFPVSGTTQLNGVTDRSTLNTRLSLQPEADRLRRKLGQRFLAREHEQATIAGTLVVGSQQRQVRIVRTQADDGETVEIALSGYSASLRWNAVEGAKSGAESASGNDRALVEWLVLDSPDQFILAQLRMASYYTIARNVMPAEANGDNEYSGPVWDVVRITEPKADGIGQPVSPVRHYFLNSSTGLPEKIISEEQGQAIVAELSGWTNAGGDLLPTHIIWSRDNRIVMELTVRSFLTGPQVKR